MSEATRRIPPPSADKAPLKANVFDKMQGSNSQLVPLFPYLERGAIVPAASLMRGGTGEGFADFGGGHSEFGHFFHYNDADEVTIVWATDGGPRGVGLIRCLANHHGVKPHLRDPNDPNSFSVVVITQRQAESGPQKEAVQFRCEQCHETLIHHEYDATPPPPKAERAADADPYPALPSITGSADAAEAYNASVAARTCPKCGTVNPPFPLEQWGWGTHARNSRIVNAARRLLDAAAAADR
jgi:predicted RNA-binding Zn-ribbon protein involved in translation (DUF1610 family)